MAVSGQGWNVTAVVDYYPGYHSIVGGCCVASEVYVAAITVPGTMLTSYTSSMVGVTFSYSIPSTLEYLKLFCLITFALRCASMLGSIALRKVNASPSNIMVKRHFCAIVSQKPNADLVVH